MMAPFAETTPTARMIRTTVSEVPLPEAPLIPAGAMLSVRGSSSVRPSPPSRPCQTKLKARVRNVSNEWYGNNCNSGTLSVHFIP